MPLETDIRDARAESTLRRIRADAAGASDRLSPLLETIAARLFEVGFDGAALCREHGIREKSTEPRFWELNGANPFEYLTALQMHEEELRRHPQDWMPWNYQAALEALAKTAANRP